MQRFLRGLNLLLARPAAASTLAEGDAACEPKDFKQAAPIHAAAPPGDRLARALVLDSI
jgi:hypothetical protein